MIHKTESMFHLLKSCTSFIYGCQKKRENAHQNDQMYEDCWCNGCY